MVRRFVEAFPVSSGLEMPTWSGNSSPMSVNPPASILVTSLEGTGGRPAPRATVLVGRLSGSPEGGNIISPISDMCWSARLVITFVLMKDIGIGRMLK